MDSSKEEILGFLSDTWIASEMNTKKGLRSSQLRADLCDTSLIKPTVAQIHMNQTHIILHQFAHTFNDHCSSILIVIPKKIIPRQI
jgi:hypothetical protein